jgi:hypothetical protein
MRHIFAKLLLLATIGFALPSNAGEKLPLCKAALTFLNHWEPAPYSHLPLSERVDLAVALAQVLDPRLNQVSVQFLRETLVRIARSMSSKNTKIIADDLAKQVIENIFPHEHYGNEQTKILAFSEQRMERYKDMIAEELVDAIMDCRLPALICASVQGRIVEHLSQISFGAFGLTRLRRAIASFVPTDEEVSWPRASYALLCPSAFFR